MNCTMTMLSKLKEKVIFQGLVPTTVCILLGLFFMGFYTFRYLEASYLDHYILVSNAASEIVHETQKERGLTAGFLSASKDNVEKKKKLTDQRIVVNQKIEEFNRLVNLKNDYDKKLSDSLTNINSHVKTINTLRQEILNWQHTPKTAIPIYNKFIDALIELHSDIGSSTTHKFIAEELDSLSNFSQFKNNMGIERALLNIIFTKGQPITDVYYRIHQLIGKEKAFYVMFLKHATPAVKQSIAEKRESIVYKYPLTLRDAGLSGDVQTIQDISSNDWFEAQTEKINLLRQVEVEMSDEIAALSKEYRLESVIYGSTIACIFFLYVAFQFYANKQIRAFGRIKDINEVSMKNSSSSMLICDSELKVTFINNQAEKLLRNFCTIESEESMQDKNLLDLYQFNDEFVNNLSSDIPSNNTFKIADLHLKARITPIYNTDKERIAISIDWENRTEEVNSEIEISHLLNEFEKGNLSNRIDLSNKKGFFETLAMKLNNMLSLIESIINEQSRVIGEISSGNFKVKVDDSAEGVFGKINSDINQMVATLSGLVGNIKVSLNQLDATISEIAQGNSDLEQRTSLQASQLEEASVNIHQISASMRESRDLSGTIRDLSTESKEVASDGSVVLKDIIDSMTELKEQFEKIYGIISVIDGISFQTNLLSLNASVEAARAGENGKGFAVVASEVRKLAQYSSDSAKETGALIKNTLSIVNKGSQNAEEGGKSLDLILNSATNTNEKVNEITATIQDQFNRISEISEFLKTIEGTVQQNSALSEENSAATASLASKSQSVVKELSGFQVNE